MHKTIREIFKEDFDAAKEKGIQEDKERVATDMLKRNFPLSLIEEISKLSEETIRGLAKTLGVTVL